jgi:hypothetical protein
MATDEKDIVITAPQIAALKRNTIRTPRLILVGLFGVLARAPFLPIPSAA